MAVFSILDSRIATTYPPAGLNRGSVKWSSSSCRGSRPTGGCWWSPPLVTLAAVKSTETATACRDLSRNSIAATYAAPEDARTKAAVVKNCRLVRLRSNSRSTLATRASRCTLKSRKHGEHLQIWLQAGLSRATSWLAIALSTSADGQPTRSGFGNAVSRIASIGLFSPMGSAGTLPYGLSFFLTALRKAFLQIVERVSDVRGLRFIA
jgi:hypothetical protein